MPEDGDSLPNSAAVTAGVDLREEDDNRGHRQSGDFDESFTAGESEDVVEPSADLADYSDNGFTSESHLEHLVDVSTYLREENSKPIEAAELAPDQLISLEEVQVPAFQAVSTGVSRQADSPVEPMEAALGWVILAAARRQSDAPEHRVPNEFGELDSLAAAAANSAPTATLRRLGSPGWLSAKVSGRITAKDFDGDRLTYEVTGASKGTVTVNSRGSFAYTPTADARHAAALSNAPSAAKTDTFTVRVSDGKGGVVSVPITVMIKPFNNAPNSLKASVGKPDPHTGIVTGRIAAFDKDGDVLTYSTAGSPKGVIVVKTDGAFVYTPSAAARVNAKATWYTDRDRFVVAVDDGHGGVRSISIRVTIAPGENQAPRPGSPAFVINSVNTTNGVVSGQLRVTDPEGNTLGYKIFEGVAASAGSVTVDARTGVFTFTPSESARLAAYSTAGEDSAAFKVAVNDENSVVVVTVAAPISPKAPPASDKLSSDQWLNVDQFLRSNNGRYKLVMQSDGNLVLYDEDQRKSLWATGTNGRAGSRAVMQSDGNLVVYSGSTGVWSSKTNGHAGARLVLQDDGNLVIYRGSTAVWDRRAGVLQPPPVSGGAWTRPLSSYVVTQEYGGRHTGIDLAAGSGTPVYAAADGVVYFEGWGTSDRAGKRSDWMGLEAGISILIQHDGLGVMSGYAHLSDTVINQGQVVKKGQLIGHVGCTTRVSGGCSGPHLHFEVLPMPLSSSRGIFGRVNPRNYLSL